MDEIIRAVKADGSLKTIKKGANVLFQGEIPRMVMIVRSGIVRAYTITSSGEERTVSLYGKNDIFPFSWVMHKTSNSLFYYEAVTDVRIFQVSRQRFTAELDTNPEAARGLLDHSANNYTALMLRITGLEQSRAADKIGFTLYHLVFTHGIEAKDGWYDIDVRLSHSLFASLVGLSRESTAKNLGTLREKGIIRYESFHYRVNKQKLEAFLGEDGFRDLSL